MKVKLLFFILFCASSLPGFARPLVDSVGVKNIDGKRVVVYKVKPKETYYSIARKYNLKPKDIMAFNKAKKEGLTIGDVIEIPTGHPFKKTEIVAKETWAQKKARLAKETAAAAKAEAKEQQTEKASPAATTKTTSVFKTVSVNVAPVQTQPADTASTQYKVSAGETLYSIAKRFNTTVENITKLNNLTSTTLIPGQILIIKPTPVAAVVTVSPLPTPVKVAKQDTPVVKRDSTSVVSKVVVQPKDSAAERSFNAGKFGLYEKDEKGVATWIDDTSLDPNKKLVLHRTAPVGKVIKITNPMTNRTVFAKVVGRFNDNESTKDVLIVMTKNVADALGAIDKRFYVNISYGSPNE